MIAGAQVDYGKANDYYAARASGSGREIAVEQFHLGPGEQHLRKREFAQAYSDLLFILKIFPNHPRALFLMIETCEQWRSPQCRTEEFIDNAVAINPGVSSTYVLKGIYLHRTRRYPQAVESFKRALEIDPESLNAHYNLGLTYLETKQYVAANEHAQRAYALGAPLPGLRKGLERVGQWKPLEQQATPAPQHAAPEAQPVENRSDAASKK